MIRFLRILLFHWILLMYAGTVCANTISTKEGGACLLPPGSSISGTLRYNNSNQTPLDSVWVYLFQGSNKVDSSMTDTYGNYYFSNISDGVYTIIPITTKPWGGVNLTDDNLIMQHFLNMQLLTEPVNIIAGDVDNNNAINSIDTRNVERRLLGYINSFDRGNWVFAKPVVGGNTITVAGVSLNQDLYGLCTGDVDGSQLFMPLIITATATNITSTTALSGGTVISSGGSTVTARGICWSTSPNPSILNSITYDGSGLGSFSSTLSGLSPNTTYYIRAYATNSIGTKYGNLVSFTNTCPVATVANSGPDQTSITTCNATVAANSPGSGETGTWSIVTGTSGTFANVNNSVTDFSGAPGMTYTLQWTISNSCGNSSSDNVIIIFTTPSITACPGTPTVTYGGQTYNTVQIGTQCIMKENLNIGTYVPSIITGSFHSDVSNNGIIEKYCLNNDPANCAIYGGLYDWNEMMQYSTTAGIQGICPAGWHIPTDAEWTTLVSFLGGSSVAGGKMKETCFVHWLSPNTGATNLSGFTAFGAGCRNLNGSFIGPQDYAFFWSSSQFSSTIAWSSELYYGGANIFQSHYDETYGFSLRCFKDDCPTPTTSNAGPDQNTASTCNTTLAANSPGSGETGSWSILTGTGGSFVNINSPVSEFTGTSGTTYSLQWTISNSCGNSSSDIVSITFTTPSITACPGTPTVTYGGQTYNTVQIGTQCIMKENLNIGTYVPSINTGSSHSDVSNNGIIEKYCYNNDQANCAIYGGLYDWNEMMQYSTTAGIQGICPAGWHIPTDSEWTTLVSFLGGSSVAGGKMKETCFTHWNSPNTGATNLSGFTAFGADYRYYLGYFGNLQSDAFFWSSSQYSSTKAWLLDLNYNEAHIDRYAELKTFGLSLRCFKDDCPTLTTSNAGPDQNSVSACSTNLAANSPGSGETGSWSILTGTGGSFVNINSPVSGFSGTLGTTYTLQWTITNSCGDSSSDNVIITFTTPSITACPGTPTVTYGGQTYNTVQIGTQCIMKENLNIGTYVPSINTGFDHSDVTNNGIIEKYCYDNDTNNCAIYGGLYDWNEMMQYSTTAGIQGICPAGWHIPTDAEWTTLVSFLGGSSVAGGKMKETCFTHWNSPNTGATNLSGFTAFGAGYRGGDGNFNNLQYYAHFWSSSQNSSTTAWRRSLDYSYASIGQDDNDESFGFSLRCFKDDCPTPTTSNAGPDQNNIQSCNTTVTLAANSPVTGETGIWSIQTGSGGSLVNINSPISSFSGSNGTTYTLQWTIFNACGNSSSDIVSITFAAPPISSCTGIPTVTYGAQTYNTVQIGTQCIMKENLNIGTYVPSISTGSNHSDVSNNGIIEKYCYNNDPANCAIYGGLYDWNEMMQYSTTAGIQGVCPAGWHIPTDCEWSTLVSFLGGSSVAGGQMKETGFVHWWSPNTGATNLSGFTAFGVGYRVGNGSFGGLQDIAYFWSSSQTGSPYAWSRYLAYNGTNIPRVGINKPFGFSLRCFKDGCPTPTTSNAGPDQNTASICNTTLTANSPGSGETGTWSILTGAGGSFVNINSPVSEFTGTSGTTYTLQWTITNACGNSSFDIVSITFTTPPPITACPGIPTVTYGGQTYNTVQIGTQCWFRENLNIGTMINGSTNSNNDGTIEKYCYNNNASYCAIYGGLYQWNEMMQYNTTPGTQGICPTGWHIPTNDEWCTLATYLDPTVNCSTYGWTGINVGEKMKETGTCHWLAPNNLATNQSGFTALGAGQLILNGSFVSVQANTVFWSSSELNTDNAYCRSLYYLNNGIDQYNDFKTYGFSVRCFKDNCPTPTSSNAGPDQNSITTCNATVAANSPGSGETGAWSIVTGTSGTFANVNSSVTDFSGAPGMTYTLQWTISNSCGNSSSDIIIITFTTPSITACPGTPTVTYEGQTYNTVQIGTQCIMKENLNIGTYVPSIYTPGSDHSDVSNNGIIEKYCYNNDQANCAIYGGLYDWNEMMQYSTTAGIQGICPAGWHIPTDAEWSTLVSFLCGNSGPGGQMKETGFVHWNSPNTGATNLSGFTAFGAGIRYGKGDFYSLQGIASFWSSSQYSSTSVWYRGLNYNDAGFVQGNNYETFAFSLRCFKDDCPTPTTSNAGPDQTNVSDSSTILAGNSPGSGETGTWSILTGTGGSFVNINSPVSEFTGTSGTTYTLQWTITNSCGNSSSDNVIITFTTFSITACPGTPTVTYGGQTYNTVQIGTQCIMKENLNIGTYVPSINTGSSHSDVSNNGIIEKYCYNNDQANCAIYGGLYDWNEMMQYSTTAGIQGICPAGWHIPTDAEWSTLVSFLGGSSVAGGQMKETGFVHWNSPNTGATNLSGFTAFGAGYRHCYGYFYGLQNYAFFWSSSQGSSASAWDRELGYGYADINQDGNRQTFGFSLRCFKD